MRRALDTGYYSYFWAEVLERDAYEAFLEAGRISDRWVSTRLFDTVLSVVDPAEAFRKFRGRDPKPCCERRVFCNPFHADSYGGS